MQPLAWYREFVPCKALQADVYALFSFAHEPMAPPLPRPLRREIVCRAPILCAPQLADGHVSIAFDLAHSFNVEGRWRDSNALCGTVVGPLTAVGRMERRDFAETVGAYFRPGRVAQLFGVAISELTDRAVAVADLWGPAGTLLASELCELDEAARIDRLESVLLARMENERRGAGALDVQGLAAAVLRRQGRVRVDAMANAAGVSRQYLSRQFRERIGIGPKLYTRIARFQSVLKYARSSAPIDWAGAALDLGFADQSHLIAEVRQFSGLTPQELADGDWFHPFIERARITSSPEAPPAAAPGASSRAAARGSAPPPV